MEKNIKIDHDEYEKDILNKINNLKPQEITTKCLSNYYHDEIRIRYLGEII